jgi:hypothetical protein
VLSGGDSIDESQKNIPTSTKLPGNVQTDGQTKSQINSQIKCLLECFCASMCDTILPNCGLSSRLGLEEAKFIQEFSPGWRNCLLSAISEIEIVPEIKVILGEKGLDFKELDREKEPEEISSRSTKPKTNSDCLPGQPGGAKGNLDEDQMIKMITLKAGKNIYTPGGMRRRLTGVTRPKVRITR